MRHFGKSISPAKSGLIYGKFAPAPTAQVRVQDGKSVETRQMNRVARRRLLRRIK